MLGRRLLVRALLFLLLVTVAAPVPAQDHREGERRGTTERQRRTDAPPSRERSTRDRDQDKPTTRDGTTKQGTRDVPTDELPRLTPPPAPLPPASMGTLPSWIGEDQLLLDCDSTRVCLLDPLDDYVAWMLSEQTTIPWRYVVDARVEAGSWGAALAQAGVAQWELFHAFDRDPPALADARWPSDEAIRDLATDHLARIQPPGFACRWPVELIGVSASQLDLQNDTSTAMLDTVDDDIAARIAEETGWCVEDLLAARRFLGSWSRTARELYISPFLFEASFGLVLDVLDLRTRVVRYPADEDIRRVVIDGRWPELGRGR